VTFAHGVTGDSAGSGYEINIALAALRLSLDALLRRLIGP
jgi:hypothetical protein